MITDPTQRKTYDAVKTGHYPRSNRTSPNRSRRRGRDDTRKCHGSSSALVCTTTDSGHKRCADPRHRHATAVPSREARGRHTLMPR